MMAVFNARTLSLFSMIVLAFFCSLTRASLISVNAGKVADTYITSREVMINHFVELALFAKKKPTDSVLQLSAVRQPAFIRETTAVLLEAAIFLEAENLDLQKSNGAFISKQVANAKSNLNGYKAWEALQVETKELEAVVRKKIKTKEFIKFKIESGVIPVSDKEAEDYFNQNKLKFEDLSYTNFKQNIKNYLAKQQVDRRLKDWFELLQAKYRVRNYLSE